LFAHVVMATLWLCRALLGDLWASVHFVKHLCFVQDGFCRPTFGGPNTNLSLFPPCYMVLHVYVLLMFYMFQFQKSKDAAVTVIGVTSNVDHVDPDLLRPGRLAARIETTIPTAAERCQVKVVIYFVIEYR
jgi:hypothetical protein